MTKLITADVVYRSHFVVLLESDFEVEQTETGLLNKCSCLARALGVTKFISMRYIIMVSLCCAT